MIIEDNHILEATDFEVRQIWLESEVYEVMSLQDYRKQLLAAGTKIIPNNSCEENK